MRRAALFLLLVCSAGARAAPNDLQLWRLGSPDNFTVCTVCNGTDNTVVPGDPSAQTRFARLTATLALAFAPAFEDAAQTTGQSGFELGFGTQVAYPRLSEQEWPSEGTLATGAPPQALILPTVTVRKGLGGSIELGVAGTFRLQPYAQYGLTMVDASTGAIDFNPSAENPGNPSADDASFHRLAFWENRYHRFVAGVRMVGGRWLIGVEGGMAMGSNPVQHDNSASAATQFSRLWTTSAHLGLTF